eukprot:Tbor_TRINITY_DN5288_c1_g5::TRINITY_DN5288_c1_g5_i1::g.16346::m.16346
MAFRHNTMLSLAILSALIPLTANAISLKGWYYDIVKRDPGIFAATVVVQDTGGIQQSSTITFGSQDLNNNLPMWLDTSFRMNGLSGDMLITIAVLKLVDRNVLPSMSSPIPPALLPKSISDFVNPMYSTPITLDMLLRHTSSIRDIKFDTFRKMSPDVVSDLTDFCDAYFVESTTGGGFTAAKDIWTGQQPGSSNAFLYSRANTALLSCIINAAIVANPALVSSKNKGVHTYIHEEIIGKLGMSNTFAMEKDGSYPRSSYPEGTPLYTNQVVQDLSETGVPLTSRIIHPALLSDYMYYTSSGDLSRLLRSLFIDDKGPNYPVGSAMIAAPMEITDAIGVDIAQTHQGYGVSFFSGSHMCKTAGLVTPSDCSLSAVWGAFGIGVQNMVGVFCTKRVTNTLCVAVSVSYKTSDPQKKSYETLLGAAAITLNGPGKVHYVTAPDNLLGLWIALGVVVTLIFVLVASYFTEYVVQPAPLTAGVTPAPVLSQFPNSTLPQIRDINIKGDDMPPGHYYRD